MTNFGLMTDLSQKIQHSFVKLAPDFFYISFNSEFEFKYY